MGSYPPEIMATRSITTWSGMKRQARKQQTLDSFFTSTPVKMTNLDNGGASTSSIKALTC